MLLTFHGSILSVSVNHAPGRTLACGKGAAQR
jgi:hypothetical protein